jgi:alpha-L-fucosidase
MRFDAVGVFSMGLVCLTFVNGCVKDLERTSKAECAVVKKYEPTWESLKQYEVPKWFEDDKFGIFIHWGVYAVPAVGSEWYPRNMYRKGEWVYKHHKQTWGDQLEFGYKDFVPMFKAQKWNPDKWAELFKKSGARFVVPVAEHHDGFAMYDSAHTRWNSVNMGPHRDIVAELAKAVRKRGMKLGASSHYAFNWRYYAKSDEFDTSDARYSDLYGKNFDPDAPASKEFLEHWYARTVDIIDKYQPDILWFDFGFSGAEFEPYRKEIGAYYYNKGLEWQKGVVLQYKDVAYPYGTAVLDLERGKLGEIRDMVWQTDTSISYKSWGYIANDEFKSVDKLVDDLVDIVSKNGCLLLNVGPKADGTIPQEAVDIFLEIGKWLQINGEAIYGTRPWVIYGEGPTEAESGSFTDGTKETFTSEDIRFTKKGNTLYAICLGWPKDRVRVRSLGKRAQPGLKISNVSMVGSRQRLKWSQDGEGLVISAPKKKPCENAFAFKMTIDGVAIGGLKVTQGAEDSVTVRAVLEGYGRSGWRGDVGLYVDGKVVESEEISIGPGGKGKIAYKYAISGAGLHTVGIASQGQVIAAKQVVSPNIDLAGKWRFHRGDEDQWSRSDFDDSDWQQVQLPASWEDHSAYRRDPAYGWYRRKVVIPAEWAGTDIVLVLGKIDDIDQTYFNGEDIGESGEFPPNYESSAFNAVRRYPVEADLIRYGEDNVIAVRVYDQGGRGGMWAGPMGPIEMAK